MIGNKKQKYYTYSSGDIMKKYVIGLITLLVLSLSGCSIDYTDYYNKYGDVSNKDETLNSVVIEEGTLHYPSNNDSLIENLGAIYSSEQNDYRVYSSYYSVDYDTLYISYDSVNTSVQTIDSKQLAMIEEHLLHYFKSDSNRTDYSEYLKVVRVYPDYKSSACRKNDDESSYSQIEGCALYDSLSASINLNGLTDIERFFKPYSYTDSEYTYTVEPKRDTFAHEFGHVSTYYNLILKGDDSYQDYLKLRLGDAFDDIYSQGLPTSYDIGDNYYIQPVEILADDYVELYYDTSLKLTNDYYNYTLVYNDQRNSLSNVPGVVQYLKSDKDLFDSVKAFYNEVLNKKYTNYDSPVIINATGNIFTTINNIKSNKVDLILENKQLIALGELTKNGNVYYRVILSNIVVDSQVNIRDEYSMNIGYILKTECSIQEGEVLYFTKYDDITLSPKSYLPITETINMYPYYDFAYFIQDDGYLKIYNYLDSSFTSLVVEQELFM